MRSTRTNRRRSSASFWLGLTLISLVAIGGGVGLLSLMGVNLNPFAAPPENTFVVRIPVASQPIPAYERIAREHLRDPRTGEFRFQEVPPGATIGMSITGITADGSHVESQVEDVRDIDDQVVFVVADGREVPSNQTIMLGGTLMSASQIIGRVLKKDKKAGMGFREAIFFPQGTPEGIAGATPPGMRAITLDATKLTGVHSLNAGDQIDLIANVKVEQAGSFQAGGNLPGAAFLGGNSAGGKSETKTEPMLLTQGAIVLKPVYVRNEVSSSQSLTQGRRLQNVPKYEIAIAFAPDDIIPLQNALSKSLEITCITHSMRPDEEQLTGTSMPAPVDEQLVPVTVRPILAYDVVGREAFVSPATRQLRMEPVSQQEIDRQGIITTLGDAIGAVARRDIPAGHFLKKSDLLSGAIKPRATEPAPFVPIDARNDVDSNVRFVSERASDETGSDTTDGQTPEPELTQDSNSSSSVSSSVAAPTQLTMVQDQEPSPASAPTTVGARPSITSFVPRGFTAFAIPWNRLYGAEHLQIGDELDLLASYSLQGETNEEEVETRPDGTTVTRKRQDLASRETLRTWDESFGLRGEPWFVASDAIVVGPVGFPAPAPALRALGDAANTSSAGATSLNGPPLLIAVDDRDVEPLAAAMATEGVLFTVAFHPSEASIQTDPQSKQIAIAAQDSEAYVQLTDTMWKGNRRRPISRLVSTADKRFASALTVEQMKTFEFRVLRRTKRRGEFFTADDFLPEGAQPGIAAAAGPGETIFAVADSEIEGLDILQADDSVTILMRAVVKQPAGVLAGGLNLRRPVSTVVVPSARIVRASQGGQTILAVADADLTRLQAAWALSMSNEDPGSDRSHLLAVALPRIGASVPGKQDDFASIPTLSRLNAGRFASKTDASTQPAPKSIPSFDPFGQMKRMDVIVGGKRERYIFADDGTSSDSSSVIPSYDFTGQ
ncbi:MAG: hypothetical protein AAFX06_24880 [Planctomycetota bacterium]